METNENGGQEKKETTKDGDKGDKRDRGDKGGRRQRQQRMEMSEDGDKGDNEGWRQRRMETGDNEGWRQRRQQRQRRQHRTETEDDRGEGGLVRVASLSNALGSCLDFTLSVEKVENKEVGKTTLLFFLPSGEDAEK